MYVKTQDDLHKHITDLWNVSKCFFEWNKMAKCYILTQRTTFVIIYRMGNEFVC